MRLSEQQKRHCGLSNGGQVGTENLTEETDGQNNRNHPISLKDEESGENNMGWASIYP